MLWSQNVPLAKEAFELQVGLAKGTVDQEMMGQMAGKFSAYFAPEVGWDVPAAGLNARGSFMDMMGAVSPVWMGLVNTKADNVRFDAVSPSMIKITQQVYAPASSSVWLVRGYPNPNPNPKP